jgi:hypothetical protein
MYWHRDSRCSKAGGFWECAVTDRERYERRREAKLQQVRDRYDADPIFRLGKLLHDSAHKRGVNLKRRKETLGALQIEGHHRPPLEQHPAQDHQTA